MAKLYYMYTDDISDLDDSKFEMSAYRTIRYNRIKNEADRRNCVAAAYLLDLALKEYGLSEKDMDYSENDWGKPCFASYRELFFNISHTKGMVAVLISDAECGVDVEIKRDNYSKIAKKAFSQDEMEYINSDCDGALRFLEVWTLKEGFIKAVGQGFSYDIASFSVVESMEAGFRVKDKLRDNLNNELFLYTFDIDGVFFISAVLSKNEEIVTYVI